MGRGRSGLGGGGKRQGVSSDAPADTVFPNLIRVPLPGGDINLISNGRRVGLIDSYGGEYRYEGVFQGIQIGKKASVNHPVYVQNLRRNYNVQDWVVKSVWKSSSGRILVTLADPNNPGMNISVEKKDIIQ